MERLEHKKHKIEKVEPLRSEKEIKQFKSVLRSQGDDVNTTGFIGRRNEMLFTFGINTGLRVSDIIGRKVSDLNKNHIIIREKKTGKIRKVYLNPKLKRALKSYISDENLSTDDWLFPSRRKGYITGSGVYKFMVKAGKLLGRDDIGTHTMRKTFGYQYYKRTNDIATLMQLFNHSSQYITLRYIGMQQKQLDEKLKDFNL